MFADSQDPIQSMALIYANLYNFGGLVRIGFTS